VNKTTADTLTLVSGLTRSTEYKFKVATINLAGAGPWSDINTQTTMYVDTIPIKKSAQPTLVVLVVTGSALLFTLLVAFCFVGPSCGFFQKLRPAVAQFDFATDVLLLLQIWDVDKDLFWFGIGCIIFSMGLNTVIQP
jgi:hypothetical protein